MNELSLFTGAGGGILASILLNWNTIAYVEYDEYCQQIIRQRIRDGIYDDAPVFGDIRRFNGTPFRGVVDIVTAGFPCQPFSVAGKRAGSDDERNMWPETLRIIREVRPRYVLLENVPGLRSQRQEYFFLLVEKARQMLLDIFGAGHKNESDRRYIRHFRKIYGSAYLGRVLGGLAEIGYDAEWLTLGADDVGAPHRRKRLWILAYTAIDRDSGTPGTIRKAEQGQELHEVREPVFSGELADPTSPRLQGTGTTQGGEIRTDTLGCGDGARITWWDTDPADVDDSEVSERGAVRQDNAGRGTPEAGRSSGGETDMGDSEGGESREQAEQEGRRNISRAGEIRNTNIGDRSTEIGEVRKGSEAESAGSGGEGRRSVIGGLGRVVDAMADRSDIPRTSPLGYIPRVATGMRSRINRLKAIGNGQVPLTAVAAWHLLRKNIET